MFRIKIVTLTMEMEIKNYIIDCMNLHKYPETL